MFKARRINFTADEVKNNYKCDFMADFASSVLKLDYHSKPNYGYLRHLLVKYMLDQGTTPNGRMDWSLLR